MKDEEDVIPVTEESLRISRESVPTGRVRVATVTETHPETVAAELTSSEIDIDRVPIGREIDVAPAMREEDGVTIIPVVEEVLVVEKRLVLREELHIRRRRTVEHAEVTVPLRRQRVAVEREAINPGDDPKASDTKEI